ncbi:mannose-6-phosphate isomerase, class I [Loigolactobacillus backii]|uniref:Mannose-6-phosphate isomerase n=1 Tax=Loigolactobacillus backii TaxID=375175 RepID=A0A192H330_9LACO|nr:mannose-6-phosphate isomerase, class I [Loigolactobacillus backii]ANK59886.1 mannose-6-phosphate isomerase [Loigolactobacillus backii]ANK63224.1 mannose-6-phosphate isomerase [Loigolactobacillus backii]ANK64819.1 mannose-6-phosphate isomerase [Loigolactobacillus backii]ANK66733.1 mannose-6-phosphate isomerase [Loigolactobacillus backii]ANK69770.1 mannose-6-phosphate isomerase [Loigolactobacillus backii]
MAEPFFLKPYFQEKIWGGTKLHDVFGYELSSDKTGECWAISAHPHGPSTVANGPYAGETLDEVWAKHRDVFGNAKGAVFPLLTKILDAEADLSVQVHPDDPYAAEHEHELGKTECWYIIAADPGAELVYGHTAKTREQLADMIHQEDWQDLFVHVPVKPGEFYYVPSGTIHALGKGIMALETQQSSDTTYRLYDYDRVDAKTGKKRELHIQPSIDVTNVPFVAPKLDVQTKQVGTSTLTTYVKAPYFSVYQWRVQGELALKRQTAPYTLASVIDGQGQLTVDGQTYPLSKGQHFILPFAVKQWQLSGDLQIIASEPGVKA